MLIERDLWVNDHILLPEHRLTPSLAQVSSALVWLNLENLQGWRLVPKHHFYINKQKKNKNKLNSDTQTSELNHIFTFYLS